MKFLASEVLQDSYVVSRIGCRFTNNNNVNNDNTNNNDNNGNNNDKNNSYNGNNDKNNKNNNSNKNDNNYNYNKNDKLGGMVQRHFVRVNADQMNSL